MPINDWNIPSNNGWSQVLFEALVSHANGDIEFGIHLTGKFWRRTEAHPTELDEDYQIVLPSVLIPQSACEELLLRFDSWLEKRTTFSISLASAPDQKMTLEIAPRNDLITTMDRPAITILYDAPSCRFEVFFVIDETCVAQARNNLKRVLNDLACA